MPICILQQKPQKQTVKRSVVRFEKLCMIWSWAKNRYIKIVSIWVWVRKRTNLILEEASPLLCAAHLVSCLVRFFWNSVKEREEDRRRAEKHSKKRIHTDTHAHIQKKERKEKRAEWPHLGSFIFSLNSLVKMPIQTINSVVDEMSVWASEWIRLVWKQKRRRRWSES